MSDFEKLGAFYLGKRFDPTADEPTDELLLYDAKDLTTHAVCVGMTGSGKTGLCLTLLEEAAIDGVPALCIDPKGDLGNLALSFPGLSPAEFAPWIDPAEATRKGRSVDEHAKKTAELWKNGLASWGQDGARIQSYKDAAEVAIYTPGSSAGRSVSALSSFSPPPDDILNDRDALRDQVIGAVSSLLALMGVEADPMQSREHILLSNILTHAWNQGESVELAGLVRAITEPPFDRVGVMDVDTFYPEGDRQKLAMQLNSLLASPGFAAWLDGEPLDVGKLLWSETGKPRLAIMSIAHLTDQERMFFVTLLLNRVVSWMRRQSGTSSLRALVYMDEVFGFLPPVANPPSKTPMLTLLKQARAYGVGMVLATQNPVDIDYKALSNCGTWFLGRLQTERDVARVLDGLAGASTASGQAFDRGATERMLAGLKSRVFLMNNAHDDEPTLFHTRWAMSYLRGPLTREQIKKLEAGRPPPARAGAAPARVAKAAAAGGDGVRPVLPAGIDEIFLSDEPGTYAPHLFSEVKLHYSRASFDLDQWKEVVVCAPLGDSDSTEVWERCEILNEDDLDIFDDAPDDASYQRVPSSALKKTSMRSFGKTLKSHMYQHHPLALWQAKALKLKSELGETQAEFVARARLVAREHRDAKVEKLRAKHAPKLQRFQERVRKAEERVDREQDQYDQSKMQAGISVGATVLGAIFGRRAVRGATTAARGAGRAAQQRADVQRAEANLEELKRQLEELAEEFEEDIAELQEDDTLLEPEIDEVVVRPKKSEIEIEGLRIAWRPV